MAALRSLLVIALLAPAAAAAELKTLKGASLKGEVVSISDKEIVLEVDGKKVATAVEEVLHLSLKEAPGDDRDARYTEVELTDGSTLRCSKVLLVKQDAKLVLLQGQEVRLPLG